MPSPLAGANLGSIRTAIILDTSNLQEGAKVIGRTTKQIEYDLTRMAKKSADEYQKLAQGATETSKAVEEGAKASGNAYKSLLAAVDAYTATTKEAQKASRSFSNEARQAAANASRIASQAALAAVNSTKPAVQAAAKESALAAQEASAAAMKAYRAARNSQVGDAKAAAQAAVAAAETAKKAYEDVARQSQSAFTRAGNSIKNFSNKMIADIRAMRTELLTIAGVSAGVSLFGLGASDDIRSTRIQYTALLGSQQKALQLEKQIQQTARQYGLSVSDANKGYRLLLATTEGNVEEAQKLFDISVRLATLNPLEGIGGATYSLAEAVSSGGSDLVSLADRFGLNKNKVRELTEETGNFVDALDLVLEKGGATEDVALQIGEGWRAALTNIREELKLTAATGFGGMAEDVVPILNDITDKLAEIRENSPEILTIGSYFVTAAGGVSFFLLFLGKVADTAKTLKELNLGKEIGAVGKYAAVGAASLYAGSQIGTGIINLSGTVTGDEYQKNFDLNEALNVAKQIVIITADTYLMLNTVIQNAAIRLRYGFGSIIESIGTFVATLGRTTRDARLQAAGENIAQYGYKTQAQALKDQPRVIREAEEFRRQVIEGLTDAFFPGTFAEEIVESMEGAADADSVKAFAEETVIAFQKWQEDIAEIEADAADKRQQIIENAADKRQSIEEKIRETQESSAESAIELEEQIADIREETAKRSENIETEHQRKLLDIQRDFERSREDAIRNVDAKALRNAEITRDRAVEDAETNRSYSEIELEENRANAEERIADLRASFAVEEEDRNLNLEKLRQQLLEVDQERDRDLQNLADATAKQLQIREQAWIEEFNSLEENNGRRIEIQRAGLEQMAIELEAWYMAQRGIIAGYAEGTTLTMQAGDSPNSDYIERRLNELINQNYTYSDYGPNYTPSTSVSGEDYLARHYALGGDVSGDGPAMLHDREYVLNPGISDTLRSMFGGAFTGNQLVGALAGGGGSRSITWNGDVVVPSGSPSSAQDIAAAVEKTFISLLESLN